MGRIRTFLAVDPGKVLRDRALSVQHQLTHSGAQVKWVEPDNLHFTLLFLGEVDERAVLDICRATASVTAKFAPFSLSLEGVGCFPNPRRPRVIWLGVAEGTGTLGALHNALEDAFLELGCYRREERSFTPHLTLGRVQSDHQTEQLAALLARKVGWQGGATAQIDQVLVMSSTLEARGPLYTVMSRAKLGS